MLWNYNEEYRDLFSNQIHRDILIVPHPVNVEKVKGKPPKITNKRPVFEWVPTSSDPNSKEGKWEPKKSGGKYVLDDMDWVIDNSVLVKEKFKYSYAINSDTNLTFSGCNAAMVQFTIRNEKAYVEELDAEGQGTGNYYWEQVIPNLYKQEFTQKDPDGNTRLVTGEVLSNAVIEVYMYFNGDSDTLIYLGMFTVEEDKLTNNGYERQITAYDFLAFFRDMDVFNWYQHLFTGINKLQNDFEDYTNSTGEEEKKPEYWDENWIREPREKWTIKEALQDLITNLASYDLVVYDDVFNEETGEYDRVQTLGNTVSNPNGYGRDDYPEGNGYSGFGMPVMLDEDIMTKGTKRYIPSEPGENEYERYGYMSILDLEFYQNPAVMKSGSLSFGKFLEDVGLLAGRYPVIRIDRLDDNDYVDPDEIQPTPENPYPSKYNNYERCILTFKPLPSKDEDSKIKNLSDSAFDNSEIAKGFQHDYYEVEDMLIVKFQLTDNTEIEYKNLTKSQKVAAQTSQLQTLTVSNNIFASYLVTKSDDDEISKMLDKYKTLREKLFGKETKSGYVSYDALFNEGYNNIRNRCYTPYQLTTYADPVRECGDRILINFKDRLTGEVTTFYSYILSRELNGIQKMMDTYTATGTVKNPVFTDYQNGSKSSSDGSNSLTAKARDLGFMTPYDLIEYMRNCGYRLLDEPSDCEAVFAKGGESGDPTAEHYLYSTSANDDSYIKNEDATNPIYVTPYQGSETVEHAVTAGDYVANWWYNNDDPIVPSITTTPLYVYTTNSKWEYVGQATGWGWGWFGCNEYYDACGADIHLKDVPKNEVEGSTVDEVLIQAEEGEYGCYNIEDIDGTGGYKRYGNGYSGPDYTEPITVKAGYGDFLEVRYDHDWHDYVYQYPGVWVAADQYPQLDIPVTQMTKPYIQLKWSDPSDITEWEPHPITWEGTTIVRKENAAPKHRWDGKRITYTKTRDKYKTDPYKDEDIEVGKTYYYGFFPYFTADDSNPEHPIRHYTFTKVIEVKTEDFTVASTIDKIIPEGNDATVYYTLVLPEVGQFTAIKLYGKIGENPNCDNTDDVVIDIEDGTSEIVVQGLSEGTYYFCLVTTDTNNNVLSSNVESVSIGETILLYAGSNRMTLTTQNGIIVFKIYNGDNIIYQFNVPTGITSSDFDKIYVSFLIDPTHHLARPSLIYDNGNSTYNYNIETPSTSEQEAIYTWLDENWG